MARQIDGPSRPGSIQSMIATSYSAAQRQIQPGLAVGRRVDVDLVLLQDLGDQFRQAQVVFDQQETHVGMVSA